MRYSLHCSHSTGRLRWAAAWGFLLLTLGGATAQEADEPAKAVEAVQAIEAVEPPYLVVDAGTGEVLEHHGAVRPWFPASTTKLMTVYVTFKAVKAGRIRLDTPIRVSRRAASQPPSKMGFKVGTELTLDDAVKIMMVKSANDIAVVVAEAVGGSVESFAAMMNAEARQLGMRRSRFVNPHGLPEPRQYTTARDMAVLARALLTDFPEYRDYLKIPAIKFGKTVMRNYNTLIGRYPGATGMKTGFICSSGYNLVASARRGDREVIAVVFGSRGGKVRGEQAAGLLNAGLQAHLAARTRRISLANVASGNAHTAPFDMRPILCPTKEQAAAAADNPETDAAGSEDAAATGAPTAELGPRFEVGPPIEVYANIPPRGSTVAARPGPLPRARPMIAADFGPPDLRRAFVPELPARNAADSPTAIVIGVPAPPLPRPRPPG